MKKLVSVLVAALIIAFSVVPAFALPSPTKSKDYKIVIHNTKGGTGTYTTEKDEDGKHATITAHPKNGYEFVKWVIDGKYDLEDGSLTDKELTILMNSDIEATPYFKEVGTKSITSSTVSQNPSPVSPKTGFDAQPFAVFGFAALLIAAIGAVVVKLAVSKK